MQLRSWLHRGREIRFWCYTGEVLGSSKHSETRVSSRGGGGFIHQGNGRIDAPQITSTISTQHEFWIRLEDGSEKVFQLTNHDIPLRVGQRVSIVAAGHGNQSEGRYVGLRNHNAKEWWAITPVDDLLMPTGLIRSWGERLVLPTLAFLAFEAPAAGLLYLQHRQRCPGVAYDQCDFASSSTLIFASDIAAFAIPAAIATLLMVSVRKHRAKVSMRKRLRQHVDRVMTDTAIEAS